MLTIDIDTMHVSVTRGDYFSIVFSAVDAEENEWHPSDVGVDTLTFAVAKEFGGEKIISVSNVYDGDEEAWWTIEVGPDDWVKAGSLPDFGKYVWDLQISTSAGPITIIGKSEELAPKFTVWGEVAD